MASVSVPGANGSPIIFTVTGTSATNVAQAFANTLNPLNTAHELTINISSGNSLTGGAGSVAGPVGSVVLNDIINGGAFTLPSASILPGGTNQYTFVDAAAAVTLTGSFNGADTVLAATSTTYLAEGNNNQISFVSGSNVYQGSTVTGVGGDTVTAGAGSDIINTGYGDTTVFGGGSATILLRDTVSTGGATFNDVAYLGDGANTVVASGYNDLVFAATDGQLIVGSGSDTASTLSVVIADNATATGASGDTVVAGSGTTNVYDSVGGSTIFGGSGSLNFIGQVHAITTTPGAINYVADTIVGSTGQTSIFSNAGDNLTFSGLASGPAILVSAGIGNETLNGANAAGGVYFFASQDTSSAAVRSDAIHDTIVGSTSGNNYFQTGAGNEVYVGGSGANIFDVATNLGPNTHVTIYDFASGNDSVNFAGINNINDPAQATMTVGSINGGTPTLTVTFADKSSVEFIGISSLPPGHII